MFSEKIIFLLWKNNVVMKFSYAKLKNFNCNMSTPSHRASLFRCDKWNIRFNCWSRVDCKSFDHFIARYIGGGCWNILKQTRLQGQTPS